MISSLDNILKMSPKKGMIGIYTSKLLFELLIFFSALLFVGNSNNYWDSIFFIGPNSLGRRKNIFQPQPIDKFLKKKKLSI